MRVWFSILALLALSLPAFSQEEVEAEGEAAPVYDETWLFSLRSARSNLMDALLNYFKLPMSHAKIFYALAASNTKDFKSVDLMRANNLYCLCEEDKYTKYYQYRHWGESVIDIVGIYRDELGEDFDNIVELVDAVGRHYDQSKLRDIDRYHRLYFGSSLPQRALSDKKRRGGLPWE